MSRTPTRTLVTVAAIALGAACSGGSSGGSTTGDAGERGGGGPDATVTSHLCIPGQQTSCACAGGSVGAQVCLADGQAYGPCLGCAPTGSSRAASSTASGTVSTSTSESGASSNSFGTGTGTGTGTGIGGSSGSETGSGSSSGSVADAGCTPMHTCASLGVTCGPADDGCGGILACGTCTSPQSCGGNPATPGQCGCTGPCSELPTCGVGATTTLTGKVLDPAGINGLYHVLVYVPNAPNDPRLQPFPAGVTCDVCGATAAGQPLVTTFTAPDGTFTLSGVPIGTAIPLVIQLGRWRRQFTIPIAAPCAPNAVTAGSLTMPSTHLQGDLPRIAILSGALDPVECVLLKMGIAQSEFTDPGGGGYINLFKATSAAGEVIDSATPAQAALFATTGGPGGTAPLIDNYDMTILECEGQQTTETTSDQAAIGAYTAAGGRVFASDFAYSWLWENPAFAGVADWNGDHSGGGYTATAMIDQPPTNPDGVQFQQWLEAAGVPGASANAITIYPAFPNTTAVLAPTEQWLHSATAPVQFTFDTPVGATSQCGRVTFSDWHAQQLYAAGATFPGICPAGALTPQQAILEFMLFDLGTCLGP